MMRIEDVEARLDHLGEVAAEFLEVGADAAEEWSPEWMALNSIATQQAELHDLRSMLMDDSDVEIELIGGDERTHRVEAAFLASFLDSLQSTVASVFQALTTGATDQGPIPARAIDASTMRLLAVAPGSFVIRLDGPERYVDVPMLDDDDEPLPEFDTAIVRVMDVFDASQGDITGEELREAVIQLGGKRASRT